MERRKMFKAVAVVVALGYGSLLVYQGGVTFNSQESSGRTAPYQVPDLSIELEPVTKLIVQRKNVTLDDIFISVKTTKHHQYSRLPIILKTWFQLAKNQTWFFTDIHNTQHQIQTNNHMVNTKCSDTHQRQHLCCKTNVEYDHFLMSEKKWWCHFDDDNYVNVPRLVAVLQTYDYMKEWYLGRPSVHKPLTLVNKLKNNTKSNSHKKKQPVFWFATGGAGFCITRSLGLRMFSLTGNGQFSRVCNKIRLPDDCTMGFIIEHLLKAKMTFVPEFHSHLEQMRLIPTDTLKDQISFGYSHLKNAAEPQGVWNVVDVPGLDHRYDPTRFLSLHCFLFPDFKFCPR